jgi:uncharacterized protein YbbC (DUF1343 family)
MVTTGLDRLLTEAELSKNFGNAIGYLCHAASVDRHLNHGIFGLKQILGSRLVSLFSPQHGLVGNVQDNMIESKHFVHPYFKLPVHSLYSETRIPTDEMLSKLDTIIVDLQDVGTRIYTYIYTLTLLMKKCSEKNIKVVVLDRPNPVGGEIIEGNILDLNFSSFVGLHPLPVRHGLTIGEVALMANNLWQNSCDLSVIKMHGWQRKMFFEQTGLPWVMPSPNLPTIEGCFSFIGTVLYEGTNISEGRGTTRSLEIIGHPKLEPYSFLEKITPKLNAFQIEGIKLRPIIFMPTFQKHANTDCGGFQIHITDRTKANCWRLCQLLLQELMHELKEDFQYKKPPYEYDYHNNPLDLINGTDQLRLWAENKGDLAELLKIEKQNTQAYMDKRAQFLLYH